ncbi:MAG: histidinol phosphatase [Fimbriimonadaceae bacterium]|nr:histidinol phosphatase [Fimbriimonadaceae bacterium]
MSPRLEFALDAVVKAGRGTLAHFQIGTPVELKADASPVTVADREAETTVRAMLARAYPGEAILGEEEGASGSGAGRWVLDPIDGTKSFISGVPLFATLLAYEIEGVPQLGACYFPALDEMVHAERGQGAFWNGRPCRVSAQSDLASAVLACGSHKAFDEHGRLDGLIDLAHRTRATRTWGDAFGYALVATGRVEAMIDPIVARWDLAAMEVIVEEAGGRFTDFDGGLHPSTCAVASNGWLHESVLEAFRR